MPPVHPEDRPDPSEQPIRARVPEHVASGAFSTGVIVMTAQTEFILDFVQNLGRPHQIVARVVMPHHVLPQLVDALQRNIELYRNRWGELPHTGQPKASGPEGTASPENPQLPPPVPTDPGPAQHLNSASQRPAAELASGASAGGSPTGSVGGSPGGATNSPPGPQAAADGTGSDTPAAASPGSNPAGGQAGGGHSHSATRQASVQDIYDDLKIRDEILSGVYANAVMIGHGPHEFSFDFITNFYPHSAVSARVFLAAGQIPRLYESLKGTWEQLRARMQPPPDRPPPTSFSDEDSPFA
jgi:hypothetical protein